MSILLDALKKSEEQRQLGKAPSIHSPAAEPGDGRSGTQQWIPLTLMAVSAIAMAWIGWQQYRMPAAPAVPDSLAEVRTELRAGPQSGTGREAAAESAPANGEATDGLAADNSGRPQADEGPGDEPQEPRVARRPQLTLRTPVESFRPETKALRNVTVLPPDLQADGQPAAQADRSPGAGEAESQAAHRVAGQASPEVAAAAQPGDSAAEERADAPELSARDTPPPAAESRPRQSRGEPHIPEPISYWELPQGVRDSLPEMHVSVLVYAERPEDRFVLVSGQRLVEKDEFEGGVVLEEIRRDGAVFQYRNYRFLVKG